jgi:hypothetical protein
MAVVLVYYLVGLLATNLRFWWLALTDVDRDVFPLLVVLVNLWQINNNCVTLQAESPARVAMP